MSSGQSDVDNELSTACWVGDVDLARAAVAAGARVDVKGAPYGWPVPVLPLGIAMQSGHVAVIDWLLSHGADPNGDGVMVAGVWYGCPDTLQLLIDAGGDVNKPCPSEVPLAIAVRRARGATVGLLLAQPRVDLNASSGAMSRTMEQLAAAYGEPDIALLVAQEVSEASLRPPGVAGVGDDSVVCGGVVVVTRCIWPLV